LFRRLARRLATVGLQFAEAIEMMMRIQIHLRCAPRRFAPTPALWKGSSLYCPVFVFVRVRVRSMSENVRNASSFFVYFASVRFSYVLLCIHNLQWARRSTQSHLKFLLVSNKISGVGTIFGLLVHVLPGPNKKREAKPSTILSCIRGLNN
jgi:hypothetical protein